LLAEAGKARNHVNQFVRSPPVADAADKKAPLNQKGWERGK
jgi:hypothetical protein